MFHRFDLAVCGGFTQISDELYICYSGGRGGRGFGRGGGFRG